MPRTKTNAYVRSLRRRRAWIDQQHSAPGPARPTPAIWLPPETWVGDCQYVEQDELIVRDAARRLTFVHRIDRQSSEHDPELALIYALDHPAQAVKMALPKARVWAAYQVYRQTHPLPPPSPRLEEMWG